MDLARNYKTFSAIIIILYFCSYVTACKPDEKKHSAMIAGLKKNGFLKTAAAERSMQGVDRSCFVDDEPYENRSQIVEVGRHPPVKVMFPAPYVHALILDALSTGIKEGSHALVVELGIGYMTACTALMTGKQGVTVSAQPTSDLFSWVSSHIKSWLDNSRAYTHGLSLGNQIKLTTYNNKIPELLTDKYDAVFVRAVRESDVNRWLPRLKTGGIMVCLVGYNGGKQELYQLRRLSETSVQKKTLMNFQDFKPTVTPSKEESVVKPIPPEQPTLPGEPYEPGMFDPNYILTSVQVKYVTDGKVLISFCMAIVLFISLF